MANIFQNRLLLVVLLLVTLVPAGRSTIYQYVDSYCIYDWNLYLSRLSCTGSILTEKHRPSGYPTSKLTAIDALQCVGRQREIEINKFFAGGHSAFCDLVTEMMSGEEQPRCSGAAGHKKVESFETLNELAVIGLKMWPSHFLRENLTDDDKACAYLRALSDLREKGLLQFFWSLWGPIWKAIDGLDGPNRDFAREAKEIYDGIKFGELPCSVKLKEDVGKETPPSSFTIKKFDFINIIGTNCFYAGQNTPIMTYVGNSDEFCKALKQEQILGETDECQVPLADEHELMDLVNSVLLQSDDLDMGDVYRFLDDFLRLQKKPADNIHRLSPAIKKYVRNQIMNS